MTLWVFKGKRLQNRVHTMSNCTTTTEYFASLIPPDSLLTTLPKAGGLYERIFNLWSENFVWKVLHLTTDWRKVLLIYDVHWSHMTLQYL